MKIEYLGHACFLLENPTSRLLIDPFLTGNQLATKKADEVETDYIFVTHGQDDHVGDTISIAKRTGATVIAVVEVVQYLFAPAEIKTLAGNIGGKQKTPFGSFIFVSANHGSGVPGALACGYVFEIGDKKIYHAGDTGLVAEMQFLADEGIDVALLPIGDYYTMGPEDAITAVEMIQPKWVIPMHYNTFPVIQQDPHAFKDAVESRNLCQVKVLNPGEVLEI
ncbi:MAG: metal-dependent hydrolase [Firmicutes bacterium]|nr:metal-dependent hydrolase [Bacillota bacterium]